MKPVYWVWLATLVFACNLDEVEIAKSDSFIKFLDSGSGQDLLETQDGGFVCMGVDLTTLETRIIKTDGQGNAQWGDKFDRGFIGSSVEENPLGGFVVIGEMFGRVVLALLDDQQNPPFRIRYVKPDLSSTGLGLVNSVGQNSHGVALTFDNPGSVVVLGAFESEGGKVGTFLLNFDLDFNSIGWYLSTEPEFPNPQSWSISSEVHVTTGGNILWAASSFFPDAYTKVYVADPDSQIIKESTLTGPSDGNYLLPELVKTKANEFTVVGRFDQDGERNLFMTKVDQLGNFIANSETIYAGFWEQPRVTSTLDGGVVILTVQSGASKDFHLIKTDASGSQIWMQSIGGSGDELGGSIIESSTGNLVFFGTSLQEGIPRMTLVKTDGQGMIR